MANLGENMKADYLEKLLHNCLEQSFILLPTREKIAVS
jgi:hypothetical protein